MNNFHSFFKTFIPMLNIQVRWRTRKPFWLGKAKSKMFKIKEKKKIPDEEQIQLVKLTEQYRTISSSLYNFIKIENPLLETQSNYKTDDASKKSLNKLIEESLANNTIWNLESASLRENRLKLNAEEWSAEAMQILSSEEERKRKLLAKIDKIVQLEKEKSQSYVTFENLNEKIDSCIKEIVDHNYAIDMEGNKYFGREIFKESDSQTNDSVINKFWKN